MQFPASHREDVWSLLSQFIDYWFYTISSVVPAVTKLSMARVTSSPMFGLCQQSDVVPLDLQGHVLSPLLWFFLYQSQQSVHYLFDRMLHRDTTKKFTNFCRIIPFFIRESEKKTVRRNLLVFFHLSQLRIIF
jgi:hypothetical protein